MQLLDHVSITVRDLNLARQFYDAIFKVLGAQVRAFHAAGIAAGGIDAGAPGLRPDYHAAYFAAFLADPEGNRIEALWHRGDDR
jgi:catechol-2,3-dioxygenase